MKRLLFLLGLLIASPAAAQVCYDTAPSGSCDTKQVRIVCSTGKVYTCQGGTWQQEAGGAGSGDVLGPGPPTTDNKVPRYEGTSGTQLGYVADGPVITDTGDLQTKGPIANVKAFGALCDGSTDDGAAINAAIAAAPGWGSGTGGGDIFIPQGVCMTSVPIVLANVGLRLRGENARSSVIKATSGFTPGVDGGVVVFKKSVSGGSDKATAARIADLSIDANDVDAHGLVMIEAYDQVSIDNVYVDNVEDAYNALRIVPTSTPDDANPISQTISINNSSFWKRGSVIPSTAACVYMERAQEVVITGSKAFAGSAVTAPLPATQLGPAWHFEGCRGVVLNGISAALTLGPGILVTGNTTTPSGSTSTASQGIGIYTPTIESVGVVLQTGGTLGVDRISLQNPRYQYDNFTGGAWTCPGFTYLCDGGANNGLACNDNTTDCPGGSCPLGPCVLLSNTRLSQIQANGAPVSLASNTDQNLISTQLARAVRNAAGVDCGKITDGTCGTNNEIRSWSNSLNAWSSVNTPFAVRKPGTPEFQLRTPFRDPAHWRMLWSADNVNDFGFHLGYSADGITTKSWLNIDSISGDFVVNAAEANGWTLNVNSDLATDHTMVARYTGTPAWVFNKPVESALGFVGPVTGSLTGTASDVACTTPGCVDANDLADNSVGTAEVAFPYVATATASQGLTVTGSEGASVGLQTCSTGQILKNVGGTTWACAADDNTGGSGVTVGEKGDIEVVVAATDWQINPDTVTASELATDSVGTAEIAFPYVNAATASQGLLLSGSEPGTLGLKVCGAGQILKNVSGTSWDCAADDTGGGGVTTGVKGDINVVVAASDWQIQADTVGQSELVTTGTPDTTTFLRGDMSWATVPGGTPADAAYSSAWNADTSATSKNTIYDQLHKGDVDDDGFPDVVDDIVTTVSTNTLTYQAASGTTPAQPVFWFKNSAQLTNGAAGTTSYYFGVDRWDGSATQPLFRMGRLGTATTTQGFRLYADAAGASYAQLSCLTGGACTLSTVGSTTSLALGSAAGLVSSLFIKNINGFEHTLAQTNISTALANLPAADGAMVVNPAEDDTTAGSSEWQNTNPATASAGKQEAIVKDYRNGWDRSLSSAGSYPVGTAGASEPDDGEDHVPFVVMPRLNDPTKPYRDADGNGTIDAGAVNEWISARDVGYCSAAVGTKCTETAECSSGTCVFDAGVNDPTDEWKNMPYPLSTGAVWGVADPDDSWYYAGICPTHSAADASNRYMQCGGPGIFQVRGYGPDGKVKPIFHVGESGVAIHEPDKTNNSWMAYLTMFRSDSQRWGSSSHQYTPMFTFTKAGAFFDGGTFSGNSDYFPGFTAHTYNGFNQWVSKDVAFTDPAFGIEGSTSNVTGTEEEPIFTIYDRANAGGGSTTHPGSALISFQVKANSQIDLGSECNASGGTCAAADNTQSQVIDFWGMDNEETIDRTRFGAIEATGLRTIMLPNASGTVCVDSGSGCGGGGGPATDVGCDGCVGSTDIGDDAINIETDTNLGVNAPLVLASSVISMPAASSTAAGHVTAGAQSFGGNKTMTLVTSSFQGNINGISSFTGASYPLQGAPFSGTALNFNNDGDKEVDCSSGACQVDANDDGFLDITLGSASIEMTTGNNIETSGAELWLAAAGSVCHDPDTQAGSYPGVCYTVPTFSGSTQFSVQAPNADGKAPVVVGAATTNNCVKFDANDNLVDSGGACGGGSTEVVNEAYSDANFDDDTTEAPSQDAIREYLNIADADDDGLPGKIESGTAPAPAAAGEIAIDTTAGSNQLVLYGAAAVVVDPQRQECVVVENLAAADDNFEIWIAPFSVTVVSVGCHCRGACATTDAQFNLEDRAGNGILIDGASADTWPTCSETTGNTTYYPIDTGDADRVLAAGEGLRFDVSNAVSPETDEYTLCFTYTVDQR